MENIRENAYGDVRVVERSDYKWGVIDSKGNIVVPFGKYNWIDGFDSGLCRVKIGNEPSTLANNGNKWGIINEQGEEVLPCEYDEVWNFYGKNRCSTRVVKDGIASDVYFHNLNLELPVKEQNVKSNKPNYRRPYYAIRETYNDYNGTYAQDVMGWSDQDIDDVLDGEADAYWNID